MLLKKLLVHKKGIQILSLVVTAYLLLALGWWMILLNKKSKEIHDAQLIAAELQYKTDGNRAVFDATVKSVDQELNKQSLMIYGEASVFGLSLLIGLYLIRRAHIKELEASEQQNNFILAVTHELKSPLTSVKMGLETMGRRVLDEDIRQELIDDSLHESNRLEQLIDNLLYTSRVQGNHAFNLTITNIDAALSTFLQQMEKHFLPHKINVDLQSGANVSIDQQAMEIVYSNLIENSIKYAPGSDVKITSKNVGNNVVLTFEDQGPGILVKHRNKIFEKFYRIGDEEVRKTKGTGLGLYIVKQIIQGQKGRIKVKDNNPTGCVIEIKLPIKN